MTRGPAKKRRDASRAISWLIGACRTHHRPIGPPPGLLAPPGLSELLDHHWNFGRAVGVGHTDVVHGHEHQGGLLHACPGDVCREEVNCSAQSAASVVERCCADVNCNTQSTASLADDMRESKLSEDGEPYNDVSKLPFAEMKSNCNVSLLEHFVTSVVQSKTPFGDYAAHFLDGSIDCAPSRCRDVLPLPRILMSELGLCESSIALESYLNLTGAALNFLYGGHRAIAIPAVASHLHLQIYRRLFTQLSHVVGELAAASETPTRAGAFGQFVGRGSVDAFPELEAALVDLGDVCGNVDPMPYLRPSVQEVLVSPERLFEDSVKQLSPTAKFSSGPRVEYAMLTLRKLRAGRVMLMQRALASARLFYIRKRDGKALREIWSGNIITAAAIRPLKPPLQANPAALTLLEASVDRPLWASGRDAETYFDQLLLPPELRSCMGQPVLTLAELRSVGATDAELNTWMLDGSADGDGEATPVSCAWPMGFGWSSYIAQTYMVSSCMRAGFLAGEFLTEEQEVPLQAGSSLSVATDDVIHFLRASREEVASLAELPLACLDRQWACDGLRGNDAKTFDLLSSAVALGIKLKDGVRLVPKENRLADLFTAVMDLCETPCATPLELASLGGTLNWHNLMNRPMYSCLDRFYSFTRLSGGSTARDVPSSVVSELLLNLSLCACWTSDLARPWLPCLPATDASAAFGFGMCLARCTPELSRSVASHAGKPHHHVRVTRVASDPAEKWRLGPELRLALRRADFKHIFAIRAKQVEHSGALEAKAVVLGLRRMARVARWHSHRGAFLVDAKTVMGALAKGRTSAKSLWLPVCQVAALSLACDWKLSYAYLPSESNPADPPSRGVLPRRGRRNGVQKTCLKHRTVRRHMAKSLRNLRRDDIACDVSSYSSCSASSVAHASSHGTSFA
jgi:hypothetical protein